MRRALAALPLAAALTVAGCGAPAPSPAASPGAARTTSAPAGEKKATTAQLNALSSANSYLDMMGFSRAGLIKQIGRASCRERV